MDKESSGEGKDKRYNVDRFREFLASQNRLAPAQGIWRLTRKLKRALDSITGVFSALLGIPIMFGGLFAVIIGALYGPLAFLSATGGELGLISLYVNRKVGRSLQFGDFPLGKKILAQVIGSALVIAFILLFFILGQIGKL